MSLLDFIRSGVVSNLADANAKAANPANDSAVAAPAHLGLAKLAVATPLSETRAQWQEFEALLAIVAPAYNTPAHEVEWAREAARGDLEAALVSYRELAAQVPHMRSYGQLKQNSIAECTQNRANKNQLKGVSGDHKGLLQVL